MGPNKLSFLALIAAVIGTAACQELECVPHPTQPGIVHILIDAESRLGRINTILSQHDVNRKVPVVTTTLFNWLNNEHNVTRRDNFRQYPCSEDGQTRCSSTFKMTPEQAQYSGRTAFDRGHLSPSHPFTFSADANNGTFYCVNIAPQDPFTNQQPWNRMEQAVLSYFKERAGYVLTGTCDQESVFSPTLDGYEVPDCFWKLVCYNDDQGETQVVGWIGNNTIVPNGDNAGQTARTADTLTPRSQQDVINRLNINHLTILMEAYQGGEVYLLTNRTEKRAPTAAQCQAARTLPDHVKEEWRDLMRDAVYAENPETENIRTEEWLDVELFERLWRKQ